MTRPSWHRYFISIAHAAATRGTCTRLQVGCVLVRNRQIIGTGFNGSLPGDEHCTDIGCLIGPVGGCIRTMHAEANAITLAARCGTQVLGCDAFLTDSPCLACARLLVMAGVRSVYYDREYRDAAPLVLLRARGLTVERVTD